MIPSTRKLYIRMYMFSGVHIYENSETTPKNNAVCDEKAIALLISVIRIEMIIVVSLFLMYCVPMYNILFRNEYDVIIPSNICDYHIYSKYFCIIILYLHTVILPFVDFQTRNGFALNMANQIFFCVYAMLGNTGIELITCVVKNTVLVTAAVIKNELLEFVDILQKKRTFSAPLPTQFRNIIVKISDFDRFIIDFTNLYYWKFLVQ